MNFKFLFLYIPEHFSQKIERFDSVTGNTIQ